MFHAALAGASLHEIAALHGISPGTVGKILQRRAWRHVPVPLELIAQLAIMERRGSKGEANPGAKLQAADILPIFQAVIAGVLQREVAASYGVDRVTIRMILRRKTWGNVPIPADILAQIPQEWRGYGRRPASIIKVEGGAR